MLVTIVNNRNCPNFNLRTEQLNPPQVKEKSKDKIKNLGVATISVGATLLSVLAMKKINGDKLPKITKELSSADKLKQIGKTFDIEYGVKEVIAVGSSAILGGLGGGLLLDKNGDKKGKVNEAISKLSNLIIPTVIVGGLLEGVKKLNLKSPFVKAASVITGVGSGMVASTKMSNKINKKINKDYKEKQLKPKDFLIHVDDIISSLFITKAPFIQSLNLDKVLTGIYAWVGYETGRVQKDEKKVNKS